MRQRAAMLRNSLQSFWGFSGTDQLIPSSLRFDALIEKGRKELDESSQCQTGRQLQIRKPRSFNHIEFYFINKICVLNVRIYIHRAAGKNILSNQVNVLFIQGQTSNMSKLSETIMSSLGKKVMSQGSNSSLKCRHCICIDIHFLYK